MQAIVKPVAASTPGPRGETCCQFEPVRSARHRLGETIEVLGELVGEEEVLAVRNARKQQETTRQRAMLAQRAAVARTASTTRPAKE